MVVCSYCHEYRHVWGLVLKVLHQQAELLYRTRLAFLRFTRCSEDDEHIRSWSKEVKLVFLCVYKNTTEHEKQRAAHPSHDLLSVGSAPVSNHVSMRL